MRGFIAAALLAIAGTPAVACSIVPSERRWEEQFNGEELAALATVRALAGVD
jgi:hypothetical protein